MKTFLKNNSYILLLLVMSFVLLMTMGCSGPREKDLSIDKLYDDKYVFETFEITEIYGDGNEEIYGDLLASTEEEVGEGIYLGAEMYEGFNEIKDNIKIGDKVIVTYDKEDYYNSIWDNILHVQKIAD